ncbi:MAG: bifunctional folylpolyglutamate synthase/dihydrofolate synthase [Dictyoglomi bacterium]|nr:bifunctional folylpolyglutamate synthase/dihydrofolate synthase [Dictyoglomota bacterium]
MTYEEAIDYLLHKAWMPKTLRFYRMEKLMDLMDHPYREYKTVHVSGTNGKGSVVMYMSSILGESGYSWGYNISPHIEHWRERIVVNSEEIPEEDLADVISYVAQYVEKVGKLLGEEPTLFEIMTSAALEYLKRRGVDFGVIEVGIEGKYDATNIINPELSILVSLDLDHLKTLGGSIQNIAREARYVFRRGVPYGVVGPLRKGAHKFVRYRLSNLRIPTLWYGKDFYVKNVKDVSLDGTVFDLYLDGRVYKDVKTSLIGLHQTVNGAVAFAGAYMLSDRYKEITEDSIRRGLSKAFHKGRFEVISRSPLVIMDGAHNPHGMKALTSTLKKLGLTDFTVVFGVLGDKNVDEIVSLLSPYAKRWILVTPPSKRALPAQQLKKRLEELGINNVVINEDKESVIREIADEDKILFAGSLYMVGDWRPHVVKAFKK